jgi:predicted negative regulator of RcsB-dependent stress response|tara:strand:- start:475 stop:1113 length:639 start_codon:yes stop_codon:yes gene_type:complete
MNEIFENDIKFAKLRVFYSKYKKIILTISFSLVLFILGSILFSYLQKNSNEKAGIIFNNWLIQDTSSEKGKEASVKAFNTLISSYKNTGYTKIALLNQASIDARNEDYDEAINKFSILIELTDGFKGNKLFNKIARINMARLLYSQQNYKEALSTLDQYSSSSDALIHELVGDILNKQEKYILAKEQYKMAKDKYVDDTSISIVNMKLANLD